MSDWHSSIDTLAVVGASMQDDLRQLAALANNVANANTPGFKRSIVQSTPFSALVERAGGTSPGSAALSPRPEQTRNIDPSPGVFRTTGAPLDVAIDGPGFFQVRQTNGGKTVYTRNGSLSIAGDGRLQLAGGVAIVDNGNEIVATPGHPVEITRTGELRQGDRVLGNLSIVQFDTPQAMEPLGQGLYSEGRAQIVRDRQPVTLRVGMLEASNMVTATEMIHLNEITRHFDSLHRIVQGFDEVTMRAIHKFGEF